MPVPEPEDAPERLILRGALFIIAFQLDGLCTALRYVVPAGLEPGAGTIDLLRKLYDDYASISSKRPLAGFPTIDANLSAVDMLAVAETLRSTVLAFLTPDELEDRKQVLGFSPTTKPTPPTEATTKA